MLQLLDVCSHGMDFLCCPMSLVPWQNGATPVDPSCLGLSILFSPRGTVLLEGRGATLA